MHLPLFPDDDDDTKQGPIRPLNWDERIPSKPPRKERVAKMPFGVFEGIPLERIASFNPSYLEWLIEQSYIGDELRDDINQALEVNRQRVAQMSIEEIMRDF